MRPGITRSATVTDAWSKIAALYDSGYTDKIMEGDERAAGVDISIDANTVQIAFGDTTPNCSGHPLGDGDSMVMGNPDYLRRGWVRNDAAGSAGVIIITPLFAT